MGTKTSGKGSVRGGYQGWGGRGGQGRGRAARGYGYSGGTPEHKGLCSALGIHVFDYGEKASVDQIITTWERLVLRVRTIHGHDISKEYKKTTNFNNCVFKLWVSELIRRWAYGHVDLIETKRTVVESQ